MFQKKEVGLMKLSSTIFAFILTASSAAHALAADKSAAGSVGAEGTATSAVKIEPANAVISAGIAQVINQTGAVTRVNRGDGLVELATGTKLSTGDTVFAGPGSSVTLYYPSTGCEYVVPSETYFAVAATVPCAVNAGVGNSLEKTSTNAAALSSGDQSNKETALIVGGTVVLGAGILAVIALTGDSGDNNDNPATPN